MVGALGLYADEAYLLPIIVPVFSLVVQNKRTMNEDLLKQGPYF